MKSGVRHMGEMGVWVEKSNIVDLPGVVLQRRAGEQEHVLPLERRRVGERLRAAVLQPLRLIKDNLKEQGLRGLGGGSGFGGRGRAQNGRGGRESAMGETHQLGLLILYRKMKLNERTPRSNSPPGDAH